VSDRKKKKKLLSWKWLWSYGCKFNYTFKQEHFFLLSIVGVLLLISCSCLIRMFDHSASARRMKRRSSYFTPPSAIIRMLIGWKLKWKGTVMTCWTNICTQIIKW
jgi:hypothetical protein